MIKKEPEMRLARLVALLSLSLLAVKGAQAFPAADTTGISFGQITRTFGPYLHFELASSSQGLPRYRAMARDDQHVAIMFVTGSKSDIHDAQLLVGIPHDSRVVARNDGFAALQFIKNAMPGWTGAEKWMAQSGQGLLQQARQHVRNPTTSIVRGSNRLIFTFLTDHGFLSISVQHR